MKTYINTMDLKALFTKLGKIIDNKQTYNILENVLVEVTKETTSFTVSNLEQTIRITLENVFTHMVEPGNMLYNFKKLSNFIKKLKYETVEFNENSIISNKLKLKLIHLNANDFPILPNIEGNVFKLSSHEYKKSVNKVSYAASKSDSRPILKGIQTIISKNNIQMVATDSYRLAQNFITNLDFENIGEFILDSKAIDKMVSFIGKKDSELYIYDSRIYIFYKFENIEFYSKKIEGTYPQTNRIIPDYRDLTTELNKKELSEVLPHLELFSKDDRNNVISLELNNKVTIKAENKKKESIEIELNEENRNGNELKIHFNVSFLEDIIKVSENNTLKFEFGGKHRPFSVKESNATHVIVPVRMT